MFKVHEPPLQPPEEDRCIQEIMESAFQEILSRGWSYRFKNIYDLVYEEIENNFDKYQPEIHYDIHG
jgi:hypothetical protein